MIVLSRTLMRHTKLPLRRLNKMAGTTPGHFAATRRAINRLG
jgi:hypothetical protein